MACNHLENRCLFVTEAIEESASLWREADVVIRATNTDGSSLTVLEALSLGVPVVASDCAERPRGAVLFRTRDRSDLTDLLADFDSKYWVESGQGRIPLFIKTGVLQADGAIADEAVRYHPPQTVLHTLFVSNNPVLTAYHAVKRQALGEE